MKQKYVIPTIEYVGTLLETAILAGSNNTPGGGSSGQGEGSNSGGDSNIDIDGPTETTSKDHNFNAWETWDEY